MKEINVAAAVIRNKEGKIFCCQRNKSGNLPNYWEFPGGKIEAGESTTKALHREIMEELESEIKIEKYIGHTEYQYEFGLVKLEVYLCEFITEQFSLRVHQDFKWLSVRELNNFKFSPADIPIIGWLKNI